MNKTKRPLPSLENTVTGQLFIAVAILLLYIK